MLERQVAAVDNSGMPDFDLLFDSLNEQNLLVLKSYADRSLTAKAANAEHDGWLDRQELIDNLDAEELTRIHGELIALGMLKFELSNRQTGLRYCVSTRGNVTLERQRVTFAAETTSASSGADSVVESTGSYPLADAA